MAMRGRKTSLETMNPQEARLTIAKHFRRLANGSGVNMAQLKAQMEEESMVDILTGIAMDFTQNPTIRRQCAMDVISIARGAIKVWAHDGETINPGATGDTGNTIGAEIEAAKMTAELYKELNGYIARGVHPDKWPDNIKQIASPEMITYYAEE